MLSCCILGRVVATSGSLYVFGDSLSDTGRLHAITLGIIPPEPYWEARFSSGPLWIEYVALLQGIQLVNYAVGASETSNSTPDLFGLFPMPIPSTQDQINEFVRDHGRAGDADIAVLEIGGNNIITGLPSILANETTVEAFASALADTVAMQAKRLRMLGFRSVYVTNAPALQAIPLIRLQNRVDAAAQVVDAYNRELATRIHDASLIDIGKFMHLAISIAGVLGAKDTGSSCVGGNVLQELFGSEKHIEAVLLRMLFDLKDTLLCDAPEDYFFWDPIHPNGRVHRLFGYYVNEFIKSQNSGVQPFAMSQHNILSLVGKYNLTSDLVKPAQLH
ncbi:hypothetical protein GGI23_000933 [Coemansia sp. RSA 2559]|nr:hypothetical protein GGI23_000933 [Coemansia sp. RSA 2559]